jgi:hypothetical protein
MSKRAYHRLHVCSITCFDSVKLTAVVRCTGKKYSPETIFSTLYIEHREKKDWENLSGYQRLPKNLTPD